MSRNTREFSLRGIDFVVADYRPRKNEFEKGLKYQLLVKVYDGPKPEYYSHRSTGFHGSTVQECREWAEKNIAMWL